jgi:hypothetical protein
MLGRIGQEAKSVKNPLDSLNGTVISGIIITIVLAVIVKATGN